LVTDRVTYVVEPVSPEDHLRTGLSSGPAGAPGQYRATYVLAIPGLNVVQESVDFGAAVERGDSLLAVGPDVREMRLDFYATSDTTEPPAGPAVLIHVNGEQRLRDLVLEITAQNFSDASRTAHDLIMPVLSRWAYVHDVAITTSGLLLEELATGTVSFQSTVIGAVKGFSDNFGQSTPDHRVLLATYREGLSSAEPLWQALSLYKVAEGVWKLRARRVEASIDAGERPEEPSERVPDDLRGWGHPREADELRNSLQPYAGKKFRDAFDDIRAKLRNPIAHLDLDADPFGQDSWDDLQKVYEVLPGLRWMTRKLLEAELSQRP
jgi:hypothetical protein